MARFKALMTGRLRSFGLEGDEAIVRFDGALLTIDGELGGRIAIAPAAVDRVRQFRTGAVQELQGEVASISETLIWWNGDPKPLMLTPFEGHAGYRAIIRDFGAKVATANGIDRLYRGPGAATAIVNLVLIGVPVLALLAYLIWVSMEEGGMWWAASALLALFFVAISWMRIVRRWPRPVRVFDQFEAEIL